MRHQAYFSEVALEAPTTDHPRWQFPEQQPAIITIFSDPGHHTEVLELLLYGSPEDFENLSNWARDCARVRRA